MTTIEAERCPWAVRFGQSLHTSGEVAADHDGLHEGPGLKEFNYQRIAWVPGDRREYQTNQTNRTDDCAWEDESP